MQPPFLPHPPPPPLSPPSSPPLPPPPPPRDAPHSPLPAPTSQVLIKPTTREALPGRLMTQIDLVTKQHQHQHQHHHHHRFGAARKLVSSRVRTSKSLFRPPLFPGSLENRLVRDMATRPHHSPPPPLPRPFHPCVHLGSSHYLRTHKRKDLGDGLLW